MNLFVNNYERTLDEKGRIILPSKVRENLNGVVYVTPSPLDKCLYLYPEEEWRLLSEKLRKLPTTTNKEAAMFVRKFFGRAAVCDIDKQGRVNIDKKHIEHAQIKKDVVLVGANTRLELWDSSVWNSLDNEMSDEELIAGIKHYELEF